MFIELKGRGHHVRVHESSWNALTDLAREFGWTLEYDKPPKMRGWVKTWLLTELNARALARALYKVIRGIEYDCLSEQLVELVKRTEVDLLRAVADLAFVGALYAEEAIE